MTIEKIQKPTLIVGWVEYVGLPELGLAGLDAKLDTGARTSALHATNIETFDRDGVPFVRFHTFFDDAAGDEVIEHPVHDHRDITNTSGVPEPRFVIRTRFKIAGRLWKIDLSLTDRNGMQYRMIVGRSALSRHNIAVHPGKRYQTRNLTAQKPNQRITL